MERVRRKRELVITDDFGNLDDVVLPEEIELLMPYADTLLKPLLRDKKRRGRKRGGCKKGF